MTEALPQALLLLACILLAGALAVVLLRLRALRAALNETEAAAARRAAEDGKRLAGAEAVLAACPSGHLWLEAPEGTAPASPGLADLLGLEPAARPDPAALAECFAAPHDQRLRVALEKLRETGEGFAVTLPRHDRARVLQVIGRHLDGGAPGAPRGDLLWVQDVTAQHGEIRQARARAQALEEILNNLPLPVWRRDERSGLRFVNRAYAEAVGASTAETCREGIELLGAAKTQSARAIAAQAREQGGLVAEMHHAVIAGSRRLLEIGELPLPDGGSLGFAVDRTQLEELQAELDRHVRVQADVMENLATAIAIFGADLRLTFFNTSYQRLLGLEEHFLHGEPHLGDILEALRERRRLPEVSNFPAFKQETIRRVARLIEPLEELQHLPDGSTLRLVVTPHPFGGALFTYEDVTDRLALERSYNTLIEVQRETIDKLYEGVAVYGADGRLKLFNLAFANIWQLPDDFLRNEPHVREVIERVGEFAERDPEQVERMVARTTGRDARHGRLDRGDGRIVDWAQVPLPDGAVLLTFIDVTDSIRVERALIERNEALETADRLKSEFIANVSYELRTPLNAIIGFAEILDKQFFGELNARQLEYSAAIVDSSHQLMSLINDILDLASVEAGYLAIDVSPIDVRKLLGSIELLGHERARHRGVTLEVACADDLPSLHGDARRLKQALFNLVSNALQFTDKGGKVALSAEGDERELRLVVRDTGRGIAPEDRERVFGKFERGRGQGQGRQGGAGLGLALVKSLIELHGGWVELQSELDVGTTITCHVPRVPPADPSALPSAAPGEAAD